MLNIYNKPLISRNPVCLWKGQESMTLANLFSVSNGKITQ